MLQLKEGISGEELKLFFKRRCLARWYFHGVYHCVLVCRR